MELNAMNDLETLRPEVREAVGAVDRWMTNDPDWLAIRAELLRLARENDEWQTRCLQFQTERDHARQMHADRDEDVQHEWARAERAEAELAALKARMAGSRHAFLGPNMDRITFLADEIGPNGKYALVKVEE